MKQLLLLLTFSFLAFSCGDDEGPVIDFTTIIVGAYNGGYEDNLSGSLVEVDDVEATVAKNINNKVFIRIKVFPGFVELDMVGEMTSETAFAVPSFPFSNGNFSGSGTLENNADLTIDLVNDDANRTIKYTAVKK